MKAYKIDVLKNLKGCLLRTGNFFKVNSKNEVEALIIARYNLGYEINIECSLADFKRWKEPDFITKEDMHPEKVTRRLKREYKKILKKDIEIAPLHGLDNRVSVIFNDEKEAKKALEILKFNSNDDCKLQYNENEVVSQFLLTQSFNKNITSDF